MWFTQSSHLAFSNYSRGANKELVKSDSAEVPGFPAEIMNKGQMVEPEGPHSIKNLGKDSFVAYRVEYKRAL